MLLDPLGDFAEKFPRAHLSRLSWQFVQQVFGPGLDNWRHRRFSLPGPSVN